MNADIFWEIIGNYNQQTWTIQILLMLSITISVVLAFNNKWQWLSKITLGLSNIFIGIVFFLFYGTEPIQHFFAAPLFIITGFLFIWEGIHNRKDRFLKFSILQWILFALVLLYPLISFLLGNTFPKIVVYIMPCPLISLSIVIYSGYKSKNKILLILMIIWGLTGVKSFFFNALEDIILLICGLYGIWALFQGRSSGQPTHFLIEGSEEC